MKFASRATLPRGSSSTPSPSSSGPFSGPTKPIASSTSCAGISLLGALDRHEPAVLVAGDLDQLLGRDVAVLVAGELARCSPRSSRSPPSSCAEDTR